MIKTMNLIIIIIIIITIISSIIIIITIMKELLGNYRAIVAGKFVT